MKTFYRLLSALLIIIATATEAAAQDWSTTNFKPSVSVKFAETNLPLVFINVNHEIIRRDSKVLARVKIIDNLDGHNYADTIAHPNQRVDYQGFASLKYRGNTSFTDSKKKPLSLRPLVESEVAEKGVDAKKDKAVIMGMGKKGDNDWCMLAPWEDKTYARDLLTYALARPYMDYVPQGRYCEVILDGTYYGIYIMAERCTKGKDRLNLNDPGDGGDYSGDFHVEVDRPDEDHYFQSKHYPTNGYGQDITYRRITFQYKDFEYDDYKDAAYLAKHPGKSPIDSLHHYIDIMENALASADYKDEKRGYRAHIDVLSFIDHMIAVELSNNVDGYRLSTPMYKYSASHAAKLGKSDKWKMGLWDFNRAYGNGGYYNDTRDVWRYQQNKVMYTQDGNLIPFWWERLMTDKAYLRQLQERWNSCRQTTHTQRLIEAKIDSMQTVLGANGALERDNEAWEGHFDGTSSAVATLKKFISNRLSFLDKEIAAFDISEDVAPDNPTVDTETAVTQLKITSGFNQDIICEDRANILNCTTQSSISNYQGIDGAGFVFYTTAVQATGALCGSDGKLTSALTNCTYTLDASAPNALILKGVRLGNTALASSATLQLASPVSTKKLYIVGTSGDGSSQLNITLHYTDGTSSTAYATLYDWGSSATAAQQVTLIGSLGRIISRNSGTYGSAGTVDKSLSFCIFEQSIAADASKTIGSVTIANPSSTGAAIMALAADNPLTGIHTPPFAPGNNADSTATTRIVGIYNAAGQRQPALVKGLNIIRLSDGTTVKVMK